MSNVDVAHCVVVVALLEEMQRLSELAEENPFKVRAYGRAADAVRVHQGAQQELNDDLVKRARQGTLTEIPGVGKGIAELLTEFLLEGTCSARDALVASFPAGFLELVKIPGVGPKKARRLVEELDVHSMDELYSACLTNRVATLKGFGEKAQAKILASIDYLKSGACRQRWADAVPTVRALERALRQAVNEGRHPAVHDLRVQVAGAFRRRLEVISEVDFLIEMPLGTIAVNALRSRIEQTLATFRAANPDALPVQVFEATTADWGSELARRTASDAHWVEIGEVAAARSEEDLYGSLRLPVFSPETRETGEEVRLARAGEFPELLPWDGIRGVFHNHTTRSDGGMTLEELVIAVKKRGVSDHSQSAFYAQGLKPDALRAQEREVREVQARYPEVRIFWGIESDILADGSLDYPPEILERFDFVVASIHSRFAGDRDAMTERMVRAVRNPFTTFLGHPTGRLLLERPVYEVDLDAVIEEAARNRVIVEINANPARLDVDWRLGPVLRRTGALVSVNPDAHGEADLDCVELGVAVARKALLPWTQVFNARSVEEVEAWLKTKRSG